MRFDHAHLVKVEKANVVTCLFDCVIFCIHGIYDYEKSIFNLQWKFLHFLFNYFLCLFFAQLFNYFQVL